VTIVVPDASVVLKWVLQREDEPDSRQALAIPEAYLARTVEVRLPTLWRYEVGNVVAMKQPARAREAMETLLAYGFHEAPLDRDYCLAVLAWMGEVRGVSFYDASYHVPAARCGGVYVTADREYASRTGGEGTSRCSRTGPHRGDANDQSRKLHLR
jgi:predicted nucleic acid-binding protein